MARKPNIPEPLKPAAKRTSTRTKTADGKFAPYKRTEEHAKIVALCMFAGLPNERAAAEIGVSHETLVKHYADEIANGHARILARMSNNAVVLATQTRDLKVSADMTKYLLGRRGGDAWKEKPADQDVNVKGRVRVRLVLGDRPPEDDA